MCKRKGECISFIIVYVYCAVVPHHQEYLNQEYTEYLLRAFVFRTRSVVHPENIVYY